ncbi:MAG: sigma-70 family RNA polymerase sigma factor [Clostridia bacterium]|nr:sigma-70 family RNA polymerase sigma factor [Clostridia bacterium]MBQ4156798.1 sigma-70 family RNA polymerase sigma factor [Clostridia bacterium]
MTNDVYEGMLSDIRLSKAGDQEATERLVIENDRLIHFIIRKYADGRRDYEDLHQIGRIGLLRAIQNFDESYTVRFSTYAFPLILGEIRRFLRDDGQMRISRTIRENAALVLKHKQIIEETTGKTAHISEISKSSGLSEDDVVLALGSLSPVRSLTEPVDANGDKLIQDTIGVHPFEEVEKNLLVQNLLQTLGEKERMLIYLRYFERLTQSSVAEKMGLTQVQVSRLEKKLLLRMRKYAI